MKTTRKRMIIILMTAFIIIGAFAVIFQLWGRYYIADIDSMANKAGYEKHGTLLPIWEYEDKDNGISIYFDDVKKGDYYSRDDWANVSVEYDTGILSHRIRIYTYYTDELGKPTEPELIIEGEYRFNDDESFTLYVDDEYVGEKTGGESELVFKRSELELYYKTQQA